MLVFSRWVEALDRVREDGSAWEPSDGSVVCSAHFVGGAPMRDAGHIDYAPSMYLSSNI